MSSSYDQHSNAGCICSLYRYRLIFGSVYNLARRISVLEDTFSDNICTISDGISDII